MIYIIMDVFNNYSEFKSQKVFYDGWKSARNMAEAKRAAYISRVGIPEEQKKSDLKRAEAVLNSIDIMDDYSQARAEDMEVITDQAKGWIIELGTYLTMGVGVLCMLSKSVRNNIDSIIKGKNYKAVPKLILPAILTLLPMFGSVVFASAWGAGNETKASRYGRAESINEILYSPNQFAELTDEQEKQVEDIAKGIYLSPKDAKRASGNTRGFGILKSIKTLFTTKDSEKKTIDYINYRTENDKNFFDSIELTEKEKFEAKRDKQLLQNVIEKIDIASQEYAEDVELATGVVTTTALAGGVLTGYITAKILKKFLKLAGASLLISLGVGLVIPLVMGLYSAKIQKQASRVGRFKIKQELINNPDQLLYVDDEKAKNEDGAPYLNERKRPGFFKFLAETIKDNKRYNKYLKTEFVEAKKKSMARESIELTPEQISRAEQLQTNTFKMFNKLDEKSQNLSESTEAMGEILSQGLSGIIAMAGLLMALINNAKEQAKGKDISKKTILYTYAPVVLSLLIASGINIIVTKEQKKASKVANMLAINEMDDYKNFVDYNAKLKQDASESN